MIKFRKYTGNSLYNIYVYQNDKLVTNQGYITDDGFFHNDDDILITLEEIGQEQIRKLPKNTGLFLDKAIPDTHFNLTRIRKTDNFLQLQITADAHSINDAGWNVKSYLKNFSKWNKLLEIDSYEYEDFENAYIQLKYESTFTVSDTIGDFISEARKIIMSIENCVELELKGFPWKDEYQTNENLFCKELLTPLFEKMSLKDLQFTHGQNEHGKDYVFSEITDFETIRHSAVQVKAGDLDGKTLGKLKEIIAQLEDAFSIPYTQINELGEKYIDTFYIISSGTITESAIVKIKNKIRPELKGSVKFLDRHAVLKLIHKYW